jgi:predicted transcriptional regulator
MQTIRRPFLEIERQATDEGLSLYQRRILPKNTIKEVELNDSKKAKKYPHTWRRSRPEMVRDILRCLPEKITRIAYGANLSWRSVLRLLRFCENQELVMCENGLWYLTDRGGNYIQAYEIIESMVGP